MKYKRYVLRFSGDPEIVAFLEKHISTEHNTLRDAKATGRAAELLFGVEWEWQSITLSGRSNG